MSSLAWLVQEALRHVIVDIVMDTSVCITIALLNLAPDQLKLERKAYISGIVAQGCVDYLVNVQNLPVRQASHPHNVNILLL